MCKLIVGIKYNDSPIIEKIIKSQIPDLNREGDGCSGLVIGHDDKSYIEKRLVAYSEVYDFVTANLEACKMFGIHTRTKSTGGKTIENCHFYKYKNRIFAHNGIVSEYSGYSKWKDEKGTLFNKDKTSDFEDGYWMNGDYFDKDGNIVDEKTFESKETKETKVVVKNKIEVNNDKTDSRLFLENMPKEITKQSLYDYAKEKSFTGVAILLEEDKKKAWLIATRDIEVHTDFENFIMFYSYIPEDKIKNVKKFKSFELLSDDDEKELTRYSMSKGIHEIDYSLIGK